MTFQDETERVGGRARVVPEEPDDARPERQSRSAAVSCPKGNVRCVGSNPGGDLFPFQSKVKSSFLKVIA